VLKFRCSGRRSSADPQRYDVVSPAFRSVTPEMIAEAHELGLHVIPWTVNTTADMERPMDLGVDSIITDYPTRLRILMEKRILSSVVLQPRSFLLQNNVETLVRVVTPGCLDRIPRCRLRPVKGPRLFQFRHRRPSRANVSKNTFHLFD
jgi:hypothetical protein